MTPIILPMTGLSVTVRARLLLQHTALPLESRVAAALEAGETTAAWELLIRSAGPASRTTSLQILLSQWSAKELARLKLPAARDHVQLISLNDKIRRTIDVATAYNTVHDMMAGLTWPRWAGPLLVIIGDAGERDPYPGITEIIRPALPMVRMPEHTPGLTQSELLCVRMTEVSLALESPPTKGWPGWLTVGLQEVVKAKMRGEGPSPLKMLAIRQQAGLERLQQLMTDPQPDASLAMALCAPLVHTRRRHLLGNLLDLIRGGGSDAGEGAIRVAYGLTFTKLLEER
jgi:hypothetical protein